MSVSNFVCTDEVVTKMIRCNCSARNRFINEITQHLVISADFGHILYHISQISLNSEQFHVFFQADLRYFLSRGTTMTVERGGVQSDEWMREQR